MITGRISYTVYEDFTVTDQNNNLVTGIDSTSFTTSLFDPLDNEVSDSSAIIITELGEGHYRSSFVPNIAGTWYLVVYHSTYFPWGKSGTIQVFANDIDSVATFVTRVLGLVQENFAIDNTTYDANNNLTTGRIRIYSNAASVGTGSNIIATYNITATYSGLKMTSYKVVKV